MGVQYRSEIDGLRAVSVISVILYHAGIEFVSGGFVGVDVFFVISGYLITSIIVADLDAKRFSIVEFYERRARRILPALFLVIAISFLFAWYLLMPSEMKSFSDSMVAVSLFSSNFLFWQESGYFDTASELKPLLHTWSLAVEEQYYIIFPLLMALMWGLRKQWILLLFGALALLSFGLAQLGAQKESTANFYLLPSRAWEIGLGALVAACLNYKQVLVNKLLASKLLNELLAFIGLTMIIVSVFLFNEKTPFPSVYTLLPTVGAGLIIVFAVPGTLVKCILSSKPLVGIGLISYSAYLWHQPVFAFARHILFPRPESYVFLLLTLGVLLISYLTWRFVERPFRNKVSFSRRQIFLFSIVFTVALLIIGLLGNYNGGYKNRSWYLDLFQQGYQPDNRVLQLESWTYLKTLSGSDNYRVENNSFDRKLWFDKKDARKKILLVGNSHSKDIYNTLLNSSHSQAKYQVARYGTQVFKLAKKGGTFFSSPNYIESDIVMIATRYNKLDIAKLESIVKRMLEDKKLVVIVSGIFEFKMYGGRNIADFMLQDKYLSYYKENRSNLNEVVSSINSAYYEDYSRSDEASKVVFFKSVVSKIKEKYSEVIVLDRMDYVCDRVELTCFSINENFEKYFYDYGHNTLQGAHFFGSRIDQIQWLKKIDDKSM